MITLSAPFSLSLMMELMRRLKVCSTRDLSHLYVEQSVEDPKEWHLMAYYPGNGMIPGKHCTISRYHSEHVEHVKAIAQDLNTLFNLKVPE